MLDDTINHDEKTRRGTQPPSGHTGKLRGKTPEGDVDEASCAAFGYLRGLREHADAVGLRFPGRQQHHGSPIVGSVLWKFKPSRWALLRRLLGRPRLPRAHPGK